MSNENSQTEELLAEFIDESVEGLQDLPDLLDAFRQDPADSDSINKVFRSVHSVKGGASFLGLMAIKQFAHALENALDDARNGKLDITEELQRSLVDGFDMLGEMLQQVLQGETSPDLSPEAEELLNRVQEQAAKAQGDLSPEECLLNEVLALAEEMDHSDVPQALDWATKIRALAQTAAGDEEEEAATADASPQQFLGGAFALGKTDATEAVAKLLQSFIAIEENNYDKAKAADFLTAAKQLQQLTEEAGEAEHGEAINKAITNLKMIVDSPFDLDEMLLSTSWENLPPVLTALQTAATAETEAAADREKASSKSADSSEASSENAPKKKTRFLRVREENVDEFLDDVASLFITGERLKDVQQRLSSEFPTHAVVEELRQINAHFGTQTSNLQQSVVALRKVPIRGLFSKFPRMARSLAADLGKKLDVHLVGEETEVDKSLTEDLDAPLSHMVRNVCDHGIDSPEERVARGVNEVGNLWMKCETTRTHVIISIQDDGRGIDPEKIRSIAINKGLITSAQAAAMSEQESIELIFLPGFSTAETVSDISGRGVGMDVVRTAVRDHNGDLKIESTLGKGTTFHLVVPIQKAVIVVDGLLVNQDGNRYVVPFEFIREIVELDQENIKTVQGRSVVSVRGELFAAQSLSEVLGDAPAADNADAGRTPIGVLVSSKGGNVCLIVEQVLGQRKVVVNDIRETLPTTQCVGGVAQLGAGNLSLVLSVPDIIESMCSDKLDFQRDEETANV